MDTSTADNLDPDDISTSKAEVGPDEVASKFEDTVDDIMPKRISVVGEEVIQEAVNKISSGVKDDYLCSLNKASEKVKELTHNQEVLRESIQQEMTNLNEYKLTDDITNFVGELRTYHTKLKNMKKDIQYINDKVSKMKRRASKLRVNREKEERQAEENKRKELELQQQLTAKPSPDLESLDP